MNTAQEMSKSDISFILVSFNNYIISLNLWNVT